MFIVLLQYIQPLSAIEVHLEAHRRFLDHHYATGRFLASGPQIPRTGGVILAKAASRKELDEVLTGDPFYREQVASYQIIEFEPTKSAEPDARILSAPSGVLIRFDAITGRVTAALTCANVMQYRATARFVQ